MFLASAGRRTSSQEVDSVDWATVMESTLCSISAALKRAAYNMNSHSGERSIRQTWCTRGTRRYMTVTSPGCLAILAGEERDAFATSHGEKLVFWHPGLSQDIDRFTICNYDRTCALC